MGIPLVFDLHFKRKIPGPDSEHPGTGGMHTSTVRRYQLHLSQSFDTQGDHSFEARVETLKTFEFDPSPYDYDVLGDMDIDTFDPQSSSFFLEVNIPEPASAENPLIERCTSLTTAYFVADPPIESSGEGRSGGEGRGLMTTILSHPMESGNWSLCTISGRMVEARDAARDEPEQLLYEYKIYDFLN